MNMLVFTECFGLPQRASEKDGKLSGLYFKIVGQRIWT
jgi:hypothetical protein